MKEIVGDFWEESNNNNYDALVCTINLVVMSNGNLVMGAGIAKQFNDKTNGKLSQIWGKILKYQHNGVLFSNQEIDGKSQNIIGLPTKIHWKNNSNLKLIKESCIGMVNLVDKLDLKNILSVRLGCGLGKLTWNEVKQEIKDILDDRFVIINKEI